MKLSIRLRLLLNTIFLIFMPLAVLSVLGLREYHADKLRDIDSFASDAVANIAARLDRNIRDQRDRLSHAAERFVRESAERQGDIAQHQFDAARGLLALSFRDEGKEARDWTRADFKQRSGVAGDALEEWRGMRSALDKRPASGEFEMGAQAIPGDTPTLWFRLRRVVREEIVKRSPIGAPVAKREVTREVFISALVEFEPVATAGRLPVGGYLIDKAGRTLIAGGGFPVGAVVENAVADWLRSRPEAADVSLTREYVSAGRRVIGTIVALAQVPVAVVVELPQSLASDALNALTRKAVLLVAIVFIVAALVALFFARSIVRPIETLTQVSHKIAAGDFATPIDVHTSDEIGKLAEAFREMQRGLAIRNKKIEQAQMELIQSEKLSALGRMSAGITHELKNPLAGIIGFAQLGQRVLAPDHQVMRHLKLIEKEGKRTKEIIDNLLKFARKEEIRMEQVSMNKIVEDACALVAHQLGTMNVKIKKNLDPAVPDARGAFNQLEQVLINLLVNGAHAMEGDGGGEILITTGLTEQDRVEVAVADTGCGIPAQNISRIFDPFFTSKEPGKGTGLGLSVTLGIVKAHDGTIEVESEVGKGTRFRVAIPVWSGADGAPAVSEGASPPA